MAASLLWLVVGPAYAWGVLVTFELWQHMPVRGPTGEVLYLPGSSALALRLVSPLFYFFEIMGRGFFALLVCFGLLVMIGRPRPVAPARAARRRRS